MRTAVGWFSSPSCSLIYQVSKYVALFSSKGYAIGAKFRKWIEAELAAREEEASDDELLGWVEDMLAICGSRDYVFFMDAAVTDRFAQEGSLRTFLEEEASLGAEAGGKLRNSILTGFGVAVLMDAVRSLALICESALWECLRTIGTDAHILDVLPQFWPKLLDFFESSAASPSQVIDGSLKLLVDDKSTAKDTPRARRAALDMQRIRREVADDRALVERMLSAAFTAMAKSTRNHASEFLPGGICALENLTLELRERLAGMPMTSTGAERAFAVGRRHDVIAGASRDDTRSGVILGDMDDTHKFMRERANGEAEWRQLRKKARAELKVTMAAKRLKDGAEEREVRQSKVAAMRAKKAAKNAEKARLEALTLLTLYSELVDKGNEDLKDQLKKHKLMGKSKAKFTATQPNRTAYVLQLQTLLLEADPNANDLPAGDSGIEGRNIKRKSSGGGSSRKRKKGMVYYMDYEWTAEEEDTFEVETIVGMITADGTTSYANQGKAKKGTILYRIVWKDYPPDLVWYEPAGNLGEELIAAFDARMADETAADEAAAREDAELAELENAEAMPPP
jgi:hypothetical protein